MGNARVKPNVFLKGLGVLLKSRPEFRMSLDWFYHLPPISWIGNYCAVVVTIKPHIRPNIPAPRARDFYITRLTCGFKSNFVAYSEIVTWPRGHANPPAVDISERQEKGDLIFPVL